MALETADLYALTAAAYRNGVLDKLFPLTGEALDVVMLETGTTMGDLLCLMDEAAPATIEKMDGTLGKLSTPVRLLNNDRLMSVAARLLDFELVRKATVFALKRFFTTKTVKSREKKASDFHQDTGFPYPYRE